MLRLILTSALLLFSASCAAAQSDTTDGVVREAGTVDPAYRQVHGPSPLEDEIFYLLTLIEQDPAARAAFAADPEMGSIRAAIASRMAKAADACELAIEAVSNARQMPAEAAACTPGAALRTETETRQAGEAAGRLFDQSAAVRHLVQAHMRPSGYFQRYDGLDDRALFVRAWDDAQAGIDRLIRVYGLGEAPRYPTIDGIIYAADGNYYRALLADLVRDADARPNAPDMPYGQTLGLGLKLMDANRRTDAVQQRRLQEKENAPAYERLRQIDWEAYPYAAILAPGHSPEVAYEPLNPNAKLRIRKAMEMFEAGKAPVIIVSGGRIRPPGTAYTEALEMKRYVMSEYGVPEDAILIDALARHTTTNLRNTARLLLRVGVPAGRKSLVVGDQVPYILSDVFRQRNLDELGYLPFTLHDRLAFDVLEFSPVMTSLHRDATDPMDP